MERAIAYDEATGCTLGELDPAARWVVVAPRAAQAPEVARRAGIGDPLATLGLDDPGWRARMRSVPNEEGVLVAVDPSAWLGALEALRLLQARTGPFVLAPWGWDRAGGPGWSAQVEGAATEARVIRLRLDDGVALGLVRTRRAFGSASSRGDHRRARLLGEPVGRVSGDGRAVVDPAALPVAQWRWEPPKGPLTVSATERLPEDVGRHHHVQVVAGPDAGARAVAAQVAACAALGAMAWVVDAPSGWEAMLGPGLLEAWRRAAASDLDDPAARERVTVRLRRAARAEHHPDAIVDGLAGAAGRGTRAQPALSVLLPTARPAFLPHALAQVARQRHRPLEVVLAAHGDQAAVEAARLDRSPLPDDVALTVRSVPRDRNLGQVLQAATEAASGELLSKIDDDDWYGPDHLTDLVDALRWTGAPLVGKPFDFVYLARQDVTLRRRPRIAEVYGTRVAGGTLTLHRADLAELGGWAPVPRQVDRRLIEAVQREGERCYRTHSLQYVHHRHGERHTWPVGSDYHLARARWQRVGLAVEEAELHG